MTCVGLADCGGTTGTRVAFSWFGVGWLQQVRFSSFYLELSSPRRLSLYRAPQLVNETKGSLSSIQPDKRLPANMSMAHSKKKKGSVYSKLE